MSLICLLTYVYRKQRRRQLRNRDMTQHENESNTVATNLSIATVCSGAWGGRQQNTYSHETKVGEDTALLDNWSDRVAYS